MPRMRGAALTWSFGRLSTCTGGVVRVRWAYVLAALALSAGPVEGERRGRRLAGTREETRSRELYHMYGTRWPHYRHSKEHVWCLVCIGPSVTCGKQPDEALRKSEDVAHEAISLRESWPSVRDRPIASFETHGDQEARKLGRSTRRSRCMSDSGGVSSANTRQPHDSSHLR